ncbi:MAG TPA: hypothetical protein VIG69_10980 [Candidatus Methylomirabilis sp.]|jgi:hypothetical protein
MERGDEAVAARFREWDRQIAALQRRCLQAPPGEGERLRAVLAEVAAARERAWSRWEQARAGGMWLNPDDVRRFQEGMGEAEEAFARAAAAVSAPARAA